MILSKTVRVSATKVVELKRSDILGFLRESGLEVPDGAEVFLRVPGGGDWPNTRLHVEEPEDGLVITWTETDDG